MLFRGVDHIENMLATVHARIQRKHCCSTVGRVCVAGVAYQWVDMSQYFKTSQHVCLPISCGSITKQTSNSMSRLIDSEMMCMYRFTVLAVIIDNIFVL